MKKYNWNIIIQEYKDGATSKELSTKYGVHRNTLNAKLRSLNIPRHTRAYSDNKNCTSFDNTVFNTINESSAYWVGFLMADGCITIRPNGKQAELTLAVSEKDYGHLVKYKYFLKSNHKITSYSSGYSNNKIVRLSISALTFVKSLSKYNLVPCKSHTATPPDCLIYNKDFWRGMIDGDGWITTHSTNKHPVIGLCGSKETMKAFQQFLKSINIQTNYYPDKSIYRLQVYKESKELINYMYKNSKIYLERKYNIAKEYFNDITK